MNQTQIIAIIAVAVIAVAGVSAVVLLNNHGNGGSSEEIKDAADNTVVFAEVNTITAASPSAADLICYMGFGSKLKCVANYSSNAAIPAGVTKCGSYSNPDTDAISNANSDLTILDASGSKAKTAYETLKSAGMKNIYLFYGSDDGVNGVYNNVKIIGKVMGKESEAQTLVNTMKSNLSDLNSKIQKGTEKSVIVTTGFGTLATDTNGVFTNLESVDLAAGIYAAGSSSTLMGLMKETAKVNSPKAGTSWTALDSDFISTGTGNVDILIIIWSNATAPTQAEYDKFIDKMQANVAWGNCKAVQQENVVFICDLTASNLSRTTPYTVDDLAVTSLYVNPECFSTTSGGAALALGDFSKILTDSNKETLVGYTHNASA